MADNCVGCACDLTLSNTGIGCTPIMAVARKLIFVPTYKADGYRNFIGYTDVFDAAYFTTLINLTDASQRWYPLPTMKNVEDVRDTNIYETFDDQSTVLVQQGVRKFKSWITVNDGQGAASPQMKKAIEVGRCGDIAVYIVDKDNNLIGVQGDNDGTTVLYPIRIDPQSLSAVFVKSTDKLSQKIELTFNFNTTENDENLRMITCSELGGANLLGLRGLLNVYATVTDITSTTASIFLYTDFGTPVNPLAVTGMVTADFVSSNDGSTSKIYNQTDNANVTVTVTEPASDGHYNLAYAAQTIGDTLVPDLAHSGYDFTAVPDQAFEIAVS